MYGEIDLRHDEFTLLCDYCGVTFTVLADEADDIITCPSCGTEYEMPNYSAFDDFPRFTH